MLTIVNKSALIEAKGRPTPEADDLVTFARARCQQPRLSAALEDEPAYFRRERQKAIAAGWWPR